MNLGYSICTSLCEGHKLRKLKIGYSIRTPYKWFDGDKIVFYARENNGKFRFEDNGLIYSELEGMGVDMSNSHRMELLGDMLKFYDLRFDEKEYLFHSDWTDEQKAGDTAIQFSAFLNRLQDFLFLTRDRVENTFKADLLLALEEKFQSCATVEEKVAVASDMKDYVADIVVKFKEGSTAAIFPVTTEQKALEAILFSKELELNQHKNVVPFMVYQNQLTKKVRARTKVKAMNSQIYLADWEGGKAEVLKKVEKQLQQAV